MGLCTLYPLSQEKNSDWVWVEISGRSRDASVLLEFWEVCPGPMCGSEWRSRGSTGGLGGKGVKELAYLSFSMGMEQI